MGGEQHTEVTTSQFGKSFYEIWADLELLMVYAVPIIQGLDFVTKMIGVFSFVCNGFYRLVAALFKMFFVEGVGS
jgi:hypothetical protein